MNVSILDLQKDYEGLLYIQLVYDIINNNPDIHINLLTYLVRAAINESVLNETSSMRNKTESVLTEDDDEEFKLDDVETLVDEATFRMDDEDCLLTANQRLLFNYNISSEIRILCQYNLIEKGAYKNCYRVRHAVKMQNSA